MAPTEILTIEQHLATERTTPEQQARALVYYRERGITHVVLFSDEQDNNRIAYVTSARKAANIAKKYPGMEAQA